MLDSKAAHSSLVRDTRGRPSGGTRGCGLDYNTGLSVVASSLYFPDDTEDRERLAGGQRWTPKHDLEL